VQFSPPPVTSSLLAPNIPLNTKFSPTVQFLEYEAIRTWEAHPRKSRIWNCTRQRQFECYYIGVTRGNWRRKTNTYQLCRNGLFEVIHNLYQEKYRNGQDEIWRALVMAQSERKMEGWNSVCDTRLLEGLQKMDETWHQKKPSVTDREEEETLVSLKEIWSWSLK
jgi:hypothetical protein